MWYNSSKGGINVPKFYLEDTLLPDFIRDIRTEIGYTTDKMAKAVHLAPSSYNGYETANTKTIKTEQLERIFKVAFEEISKGYTTQKSDDLSDWRKHIRVSQNYKEYVLEKIKKYINTYTKQRLQNELWLHALYLQYSEVDTNELMWKKLTSIYNTKGWKSTFATLNDNISIKKPDNFPDKNEIYIKPLTKTEIAKNFFPVPQICYELTEEQLIEKENKAFDNDKINMADLFMLIFNWEFKNGCNGQEAFKNTCICLHELGAKLIYNTLGMIENLPEDNPTLFFKYDINMFKELKEILSNTEIDEADKSLKIFKSNLTNSKRDFLDVVAIDFNFIKELTPALENELHRRIKATVDNFKNEYPISEK